MTGLGGERAGRLKVWKSGSLEVWKSGRVALNIIQPSAIFYCQVKYEVVPRIVNIIHISFFL